MKVLEKNSGREILLAAQCAEVLAQGVSLLQDINDGLYASSVGSHFRHILDFADNFVNGLNEGRINYNQRERDLQVEQNREKAIERLLLLIVKLQNLSTQIKDKKILVSLETSLKNSTEEFCDSSVLRELDFLQSHTIHHYALIAAKLSANGYEVDAEFGVAPSTLEYWKKQNKAEKVVAK